MNKFSLNESQDHVVLDNAGPMHYRFWLLHSTKRAPGAKHRREYRLIPLKLLFYIAMLAVYENYWQEKIGK